MNRFAWNMRYPDATNVPGAIFWAGSVDGPIAPPGHYQVRLTVGETTQTAPFEIHKDPRVAATQEELDAQFALLLQIRDQLTRAHDGHQPVAGCPHPGRGLGEARRGARGCPVGARRGGGAEEDACRG